MTERQQTACLDFIKSEIDRHPFPLVILLIGLPGAGKTSIRNAIDQHFPNTFSILSFDDHVFDYANEISTSYEEIHRDLDLKQLVQERFDNTKERLTSGKGHTICDLCNLTVKDRAKLVKEFKPCRCYGIYLPVSVSVAKQRCDERATTEEKVIQEKVIDLMASSLEEPQAKEFDFFDVIDA